MHIRALLLAGALLAGPVTCSKVPVGAIDLTIQAVEGAVCKSLDDLQAMFTTELEDTSYVSMETALATFNEVGGHECELLAPTMVEKPLRLGTYKTVDGIILEIFSFEVGPTTYFIGLVSDTPYA